MKTTMNMKHIISVLLVSSLAACGGAGKHPKSGLGGGEGAPPPPDVTAGGGAAKDEKKPEFTVDARKDFESAAKAFADYEKGGWNESACRGSADKFAAVVREHRLVEAQYMVGRSYHACGMAKDAEAARITLARSAPLMAISLWVLAGSTNRAPAKLP